MSKSSWFAIVISTLVATTLIGCSEKVPSLPAPEKSTPESKSDARAALIKSLETRAAQSDGDAQLSLAKVLLDGTDVKPDFAKVKELLEKSAAKGLPEASLGLVLLKRSKVLPDEQLPSVEILREKASATNDAFVTTFLSPSLPDVPSKVVLGLAKKEYPLAMARVLEHLGFCISMNAHSKINGEKTMDFCRAVERDKNAFQNSVALGNALIQKMEVDAEKQRYWGTLRRRLNTYRPSADDPLNALKFDHVLKKSDLYFAAIAPALSNIGRNLKDGLGGQASPAKAVAFLKRAAELGDSDAQNAMGELYLAGRGVQKIMS